MKKDLTHHVKIGLYGEYLVNQALKGSMWWNKETGASSPGKGDILWKGLKIDVKTKSVKTSKNRCCFQIYDFNTKVYGDGELKSKNMHYVFVYIGDRLSKYWIAKHNKNKEFYCCDLNNYIKKQHLESEMSKFLVRKDLVDK